MAAHALPSNTERQLQLDQEIAAFETWKAERSIWHTAQGYFARLWREHVVSDFPEHYDPELF